MTGINDSLPLLGWREWVALPHLNINELKAKIDTGARSSALHAFSIEPYRKNGQRWVMFAIHPQQKNIVTDSGGHKQRRYVIETELILGSSMLRAEITLTNRDSMLFRMLIGRTTINTRFIIDPNASYLQGIPSHLKNYPVLK